MQIRQCYECWWVFSPSWLSETAKSKVSPLLQERKRVRDEIVNRNEETIRLQSVLSLSKYRPSHLMGTFRVMFCLDRVRMRIYHWKKSFQTTYLVYTSKEFFILSWTPLKTYIWYKDTIIFSVMVSLHGIFNILIVIYFTRMDVHNIYH